MKTEEKEPKIAKPPSGESLAYVEGTTKKQFAKLLKEANIKVSYYQIHNRYYSGQMCYIAAKIVGYANLYLVIDWILEDSYHEKNISNFRLIYSQEIHRHMLSAVTSYVCPYSNFKKKFLKSNKELNFKGFQDLKERFWVLMNKHFLPKGNSKMKK